MKTTSIVVLALISDINAVDLKRYMDSPFANMEVPDSMKLHPN